MSKKKKFARTVISVAEGVAPTACCDPNSTRYAMGCALVTPAADGVFVSATGSRCATAIKCGGTASEPHLMPMKIVGKGKKPDYTGRSTQIVFDGRWECDGRVMDCADNSGRFPDLPRVMPDVDVYGNDAVVVEFSASLIAKIAAALGDELVLIFRRDVHTENPEHDPRRVVDAITVLGESGVGILMPLTSDNVDDSIRRVKEFTAEYAKTFANPDPIEIKTAFDADENSGEDDSE